MILGIDFGATTTDFVLMENKKVKKVFSIDSDKIKDKFRFLIVLQIVVSYLPILLVFLIRVLRNVIYPIGMS